MASLNSALDSVGNVFSGVGDVVNDSKGRQGTVQAVLPRSDGRVFMLVRYKFAFGAELARISEFTIHSALLTLVSRADGVALAGQLPPGSPEPAPITFAGNTSDYLDQPF